MENIYLIRKTVQHMAQLLETLVRQQCAHRGRCRVVSAGEPMPGGDPEADSPVVQELITIKEAAAVLNVSRYTVDAMRKRGQLTSIRSNGRVRLKRHEVLDARKWYSVLKGKV